MGCRSRHQGEAYGAGHSHHRSAGQHAGTLASNACSATAVGEKLSALAWNRDPRAIRTQHRARSAGAQSALGRKPAVESVFKPALLHLADRVASRLRAKSLAGQHCHGAGPVRRHAGRHQIDDAGCADFGDGDAGGDCRGTGAGSACRSSAGADDHATGDVGFASAKAAGDPARSAARASGRKAQTRRAKKASPAGPPTAPSTLFATALAVTRSAMPPQRWTVRARSPTDSANWPRRSCKVRRPTPRGEFPLASEASSSVSGNDRCSRWDSARDNPGARARLPRNR